MPGGHSSEVRDVAWDPKGNYVLSVGKDQTTRVHARLHQQVVLSLTLCLCFAGSILSPWIRGLHLADSESGCLTSFYLSVQLLCLGSVAGDCSSASAWSWHAVHRCCEFRWLPIRFLIFCNPFVSVLRTHLFIWEHFLLLLTVACGISYFQHALYLAPRRKSFERFPPHRRLLTVSKRFLE